jgi:beta-phosphoglucomutase
MLTFAHTMKKAFIFDLNGTMVHDMHFHADAWGTIINNELSGNLTPEQVKREMYGKNEEVLERVFGKGKFTEQEMEKLSRRKEEMYQEAFRPHLQLIDGLHQFLQKAYEQNIPMAIGSAAIPFNIDFVLDNLGIRHYFSAVVSAADVVKSKPHPQTFLDAAEKLGVNPADCIVFEDAPKGVETALNAGMQAVAITTTHEPAEFKQYQNILMFIKDYTDERLEQFFLTYP